ncbi:hypothetical protein RI054_26g108520 [Pseudoscourfieldia marina]
MEPPKFSPDVMHYELFPEVALAYHVRRTTTRIRMRPKLCAKCGPTIRINNPADLLTKPLSRTQLRHLFRILRRLAWGGDSDSSNTPHGSKPKQLKRAPHDSASAQTQL